MRHSIPVLAALAALATPTVTAAQVCVGGPALASMASGNIGGSVSFFDGGKTYGASATFGSAFFGGGSFSYTDYDDTDLSLKQIGASLGYEIAPSESEVAFCPTVAIGYGFGLEVLGIDVTTVAVSPGVAIGLEAEVSPTITVIPAAQLALVYQRVTADAGPLGEETVTETDGALVLGAGFVFNRRLAVGPSVYIPLAAENGNTVFGVWLAVAVGGGS